MEKKLAIPPLILDTLIVLAGFAIVIYAALAYFIDNDPAEFLVFLAGFIIVCIGMDRRFRGYWK